MVEFDHSPDVQEFFGEHVAHAMRDLKVETSAQTQGYLVDLLSGFTVSHRIHSLAVPLAGLLKRAMDTSGAQRLALLRELGDAALFLCGFFPDSFDRRGVDRTYVVTMGGRAYLVVGRNDRDKGRAAVFSELSGRFGELAGVLDEVRERTAMCTEGAIVRIYERWLESGSPALARRLRRRGLHPVRMRRRGRVH
jgi:hypothetical protein